MTTISPKEMLETGRRTAISTSELGLYSDRGERYHRNRYSSIVRKFVIGVMVVMMVLLVVIFLYDFTSATVTNKGNQETKHIYILQNALKKSSNFSRKTGNWTTSPVDHIANQSDSSFPQSRFDNVKRIDEATQDPIQVEEQTTLESEFRMQNLNNFKLRKRVLKSIESTNEEDAPEGKQLFDNHAMVYRVRHRYKYPDSEEDTSVEENRPLPFHWEFKTPHPSSFKRLRYPQLSQYRYPQSSRNIQDIIKYLTNDAEISNRGIKFTGVYVNPKKYDLYSEVGETMANSDRSEEVQDDGSHYPIAFNGDPFYQYKPKHPADVNLLATSNVRFSPIGLHRYNPFYDSLYPRPIFGNKQPFFSESQTDNSYASNVQAKRRKPKPFSVMLDIYPITDIVEQNKKSAKPRPLVGTEDHDVRRPIQFNRGPKLYSPLTQPIPVVALPSQQSLTAAEEEERQQMIFHLNLYPRRKNKMSRYDIIQRSESMQPEERQQFAQKIMTPLESIAKHLTDHSTIENSKYDEDTITRYHEINLDSKEGEGKVESVANHMEEDREIDGSVQVDAPIDHKSNNAGNFASSEKLEITAMSECTDCNANDEGVTTPIEDTSKTNEPITDPFRDIDTVEGFQRFNDDLLDTVPETDAKRVPDSSKDTLLV